MDDELRVWLKTFDGRLSEIERSMKVVNHELGELMGGANSKVNPTVSLIIRFVVLPLIVILGSLYGVTTLSGG